MTVIHAVCSCKLTAILVAVLGLSVVVNRSDAETFGDINGDGHVDAADLNIIGINWRMSGKTKEEGDLTGDGVVDAADLNELGVFWQTWLPMPHSVGRGWRRQGQSGLPSI